MIGPIVVLSLGVWSYTYFGLFSIVSIHNFPQKNCWKSPRKKLKTTSNYWFSYQNKCSPFQRCYYWMNELNNMGSLGEKTISRLSPVGFKMHTRAIWSSIWISVGNGLEFEKKILCAPYHIWIGSMHLGFCRQFEWKNIYKADWARSSPCGKCLGHWLRIPTLLNNHYEMLYVGGWFGLQ